MTIAVLANDSAAPGLGLTIESAQAGTGQVVINPDNTLTYEPAPDFNGTNTITYTVNDGHGGTATATVSVTVAPVNDPPLGADDTAATNEDEPVTIAVLGNDSDIDGDKLTVTAASTQTGSVVINPDGTLTYKPAPDFSGTGTIVYTIDDGNGGTDSATVTVAVGAVN